MNTKEKFINLHFNFNDNFKSVDERYCKKYKKLQRHMVDEDNTLDACKSKCNSFEDQCDTIAVGEGKSKGKKYNCTTYKKCVLSPEGSSISYTKDGKYEFYTKDSKKEGLSIHIIFLMILVFQMLIMVGYGAMIISRSLRRNI